MSRSVDQILDSAKLAEQRVPVYLGGDRDLAVRYEHLDRELITASERVPDSLAAGSPARAIEEEMASIRERMADDTVEFTLRALRRKVFRALSDAHPPRKNADGDILNEDRMGFNVATFFDPLVRASIVDPELTHLQLDALVEEQLTEGQFLELALAAYHLNVGKVDVPFSSAASRTTRTSGLA